jgi:hypothetical protein
MKLKHEPHSEVAKLTTQNCTPAAPKRLSQPVDRLVLSGSKLIITGSDPILPDEINAAFNDPNVSNDSIDLSDGDEIPLTKNSNPEKHSIKSFFRSIPTGAPHPIIEVEEECLCGEDAGASAGEAAIQCKRCSLCVKCCQCDNSSDKPDIRQYFQPGPARR